MKKYTFKKEERLCSKRLIDSLFHNGSSFIIYPFRAVYLFDVQIEQPVQVIISASKRRFKHAVKRNRIKRLMREAYRYEKPDHLHPFLIQHSLHLLLAIQYVGKEEFSLEKMKKKLVEVFQKLKNERNEMALGKSN